MIRHRPIAAILLIATLTGCQGLQKVLEVILSQGPVPTGPSGSPPGAPPAPPSQPPAAPPPNGGGNEPVATLPPGHAVGPSLAELDAMASAMLTRGAPGTSLRGTIVEDVQRSGGVAAIGYGGGDSIIYVHPAIRRSWSVNTWAFIIGHELSHALLQHRGGPQDEWEADARGAKLADAVGYDVSDYIRFICSGQPNSCSPSHGCFHDRMRRLEDEFNVSACESSGDHSGHAMALGLSGLAPPSPDWAGPCIVEMPR